VHEIPTLAQLARQVMTQEVGESQTSEALAVVALNAYAKFLTSVAALVGTMGSVALLRRSLFKKEPSIPYTQVLADEQNGLLNAIGHSLRTQTPDAAREASIALLSHYLELLAAFIGERLTRQLVHDAWPERLAPRQRRKQDE
jgi:hypothetical protein